MKKIACSVVMIFLTMGLASAKDDSSSDPVFVSSDSECFDKFTLKADKKNKKPGFWNDFRKGFAKRVRTYDDGEIGHSKPRYHFTSEEIEDSSASSSGSGSAGHKLQNPTEDAEAYWYKLQAEAVKIDPKITDQKLEEIYYSGFENDTFCSGRGPKKLYGKVRIKRYVLESVQIQKDSDDSGRDISGDEAPAASRESEVDAVPE